MKYLICFTGSFSLSNSLYLLQCKQKMRPVKNWLKAINETDASLPDDEPLRHFTKCLVKIGQHNEDDTDEDIGENLFKLYCYPAIFLLIALSF